MSTSPGVAGARRRWLVSPPLAVQYSVATWVVAMAVVWAGAALYLYWNQQRAAEQVRASARAVAATVAATAAESLATGRNPDLIPAIHAASHQPDIAYVRVTARDGSVLASGGNPAVPAGRVWVEVVPVTYFNVPQGRVEVAIYRAAARQVLAQWGKATVWLSLAATVLSAGMAVAVALRTTGPIRRLRGVAVRWEEPYDLDFSGLSGPREVVQLAEALQAMRTQALARRQVLEALVALRTHELEQAYAAVEESLYQTAAALARALDARDRYTARHSSRVADLTRQIAERMTVPAAEARTFVLAASLHDIGKIGVTESILQKAGPLTPEERVAMQAHAVIGAKILEPVRGMEAVARLIRHHHERWDGTGYPDGLSAADIPLGSRIIAVADALEAMCSRRPYRDPLPAAAALAEIRRCTGTQFDPAVVETAWPLLERAAAEWRPVDADIPPWGLGT